MNCEVLQQPDSGMTLVAPTEKEELVVAPAKPDSLFVGELDSIPAISAQVLQLKWQMFYVQKSQQELATAILQLSSMILSSQSSNTENGAASGGSVPTAALTFDPTKWLSSMPAAPATKRKWNTRLEDPQIGNCTPEKVHKMPVQMATTTAGRAAGARQRPSAPNHGSTKSARSSSTVACKCDACLHGFPGKLPNDKESSTEPTWSRLPSTCPTDAKVPTRWDLPLGQLPPAFSLGMKPGFLSGLGDAAIKADASTNLLGPVLGDAWPTAAPFLPSDLPSLPQNVERSCPQNSLELYFSYLLGSLDPKVNTWPPVLPTVDQKPINSLQEKPMDLVTHSRNDFSTHDQTAPRDRVHSADHLNDAMSEGDLPRIRSSHSSITVPSESALTTGLLSPPGSSLEISPRCSSQNSIYAGFRPAKRRHTTGTSVDVGSSVGEFPGDSAAEDLIKFENDRSWGRQPPDVSLLTEKDRAVVVLNPNEPKEMFVGGDPHVRLPVWAYKKCVYMVGREQKRPAARLCLCLLQSLFSLRYLVSHNYSGSRQKRPIDPTVMKAVLKQSLMQFGPKNSFGDQFSQGKLRDYLNNAFRVMAFRRRRGDRVKSPFWNDAGDPILTLDPPKDFRLNDLILTKVLPMR